MRQTTLESSMKLLLVAFFQLLAMVEMALGVLIAAESGGVGIPSLIAVAAALVCLFSANEVSKS
jgi:hypothetical protein